MDNIPSTKVRIDLRERIIELEGSEEFVSTQLHWIKDLMLNTPMTVDTESFENKTDELPTKGAENNNTNTTGNNTNDRYKSYFGANKEIVDNVIHTEESGFRIITTGVKGATAEMQTNYCLLYCLAKEFYGQQDASFEELRDLCKINACLDESNFSAIFNRGDNKKFFLVSGKPRSRSKAVKLTTPGRTKAKELLLSLAS